MRRFKTYIFTTMLAKGINTKIEEVESFGSMLDPSWTKIFTNRAKGEGLVWRTCLSIWFSFCNVDNFSSSSEFLFSKFVALSSNSLKYTFFLSLACCAETLFLNNLQDTKMAFSYQYFLHIRYDRRNLQLYATFLPYSRPKILPLQPFSFFLSRTSPSAPYAIWCGRFTWRWNADGGAGVVADLRNSAYLLLITLRSYICSKEKKQYI